MKYCFKVFLFLLLPVLTNAQYNPFAQTKQQADSQRLVLQHTDNDTLKLHLSQNLALYYIERNRDSAIYFSEQELAMAIKFKKALWQVDALSTIGYEWMNLGNYPKALQALNDALKLAEDETNEQKFYPGEMLRGSSDPHIGRLSSLANVYQQFGLLYRNTGKTIKLSQVFCKPSVLQKVLTTNLV